jgi:hypothetical protein
MTHHSVLILALMEDGIEPTPEAIQQLDGQIDQLAHFLVDYYNFRKSERETLRNARIGLIAKLKQLARFTPMATSKSPTCGRVKIPHPGRQQDNSLLTIGSEIQAYSFFIQKLFVYFRSAGSMPL